MKRFIAAALTLALAATFCSCSISKKTNKEVSGTIESSATTSSAVTSGVGEASNSYALGEVLGGVYTNSFLGIGCELDEDWTFATDEEILETNNIAFGMLDGDVKELLENAAIVYDMMAKDSNGTRTINVNVENLGINGNLMSVEDYLSPQIGLLKEALEDMGMTEVTIGADIFNFAGNTENGIYISGKISGVDFEEVVITLKRGGRFANITIGTYYGDLAEIMSCFFPLS